MALRVCARVSVRVAHMLQLLEVKWSEQSGMEMDNALHSKQWHSGEGLGCDRTKHTSECESGGGVEIGGEESK